MKTATRPAYRPYVAVVKGARRLSPHFARITFTSPDFDVFGTDRRDQRVKIVLPGPDGTLCDIGQTDPAAIDNGEWYARWRDLPDEERMPFRTYTVRRIDPEALELDIDFVLHHDAGPAGAWAEAATIGDRILVVGPDARSAESAQGIDFHPGTAQRLLLAGDETAAPAICAILGQLPWQARGAAFLEVPTAADVLSVVHPEGVEVVWLPRDGGPVGSRVHDAVLTHLGAPDLPVDEPVEVDPDLWETPTYSSSGEEVDAAVTLVGHDLDGLYAWIAGESAMVTTLCWYSKA
ncbi:siderophore-interacting protein, partial [Microbacterium sp. SCN 71-17]|uniref:siderophore-interacting protein n=1 Tax=Microbacterium sp. SCN 71-17 TaxID=1660111 RepID=UPI000AA0E356